MALTLFRKLFYACMAIVLAFSFSVFPALPSYALTENEAILDEAQKRLDQISSEYDELSAEISELQTEIDDLAVKVLEAQQAMLDGRAALGSTVLYEYRGGSLSTMLSVLVGSADISELTRNMNYVNQIMDHQAEEINAQKEIKEEFTRVSDQLTAQKDEQDKKLEELATKRDEATAVVEEASAQVEADNARIEKMRKQADQFIWGGVKENDPPAQDNADNAAPPSNKTPVSGAYYAYDSTIGSASFVTLMSSAYGGSSDASTGAVSTTANGSVCNDSSMGIAIPMSGSLAERKYYGRTVQITYNGRSAYATINDCGNMHLYGCTIDLQPGVWKALDPNATTCAAWGHRNVQYRLL